MIATAGTYLLLMIGVCAALLFAIVGIDALVQRRRGGR